jgi:phage/plasmid-like protein (TIGR03299 family)
MYFRMAIACTPIQVFISVQAPLTVPRNLVQIFLSLSKFNFPNRNLSVELGQTETKNTLKSMPAMVETMAFSGKVPWHGLGVPVEEADLYNWESFCEKSGLNWDADLVPLVCKDSLEEVDRFAVRRRTDNKILGNVGARYTILQNRDAFAWFKPFLDAQESQLHTAGSLCDGSRVWVLAKLNRDPIEVLPGDTVDKFLLLSHSHDGSLAVRIGFTPVRVVCVNTLAMAHSSNASKLIRCKHSSKVHENLDNIRETMNLANQEFEATAEQYKLLVRKDISQADLEKYVKKVLEVEEPKEGKEIPTRTKNIMEEIFELFETGKGTDIPGVKGTYWGAYNSVTEYFSYNAGRNASNRLNSLWFGANSNANKLALQAAVDMSQAA